MQWTLPAIFTAIVVGVAMSGLAVVMLADAAGGHSEVRFRAPEDNQVVGGTVDRIDIQFWTPVDSSDITVTDPNGAAVDVGETTVASRGFIASTEFDPLTEPGVYRVEHLDLSVDGDFQLGEFDFAYDPDSSERVAALVAEESGPNWLLLAGIGVIVAGIAGLLVPRRGSKTS